jgi:hypothetical protein
MGWGVMRAAGPLQQHVVEIIKSINAKAGCRAPPRVVCEIPPLNPARPALIHQTHNRAGARNCAAFGAPLKPARNPSEMAEKPGDNSPARPVPEKRGAGAILPRLTSH